MTELDKLALEALQELEEEFSLPEKQPGDYTIAEIKDIMKCSDSTARDRMKNKVEAGEWISKKVRDNTAKAITVYRRVLKDEK